MCKCLSLWGHLFSHHHPLSAPCIHSPADARPSSAFNSLETTGLHVAPVTSALVRSGSSGSWCLLLIATPDVTLGLGPHEGLFSSPQQLLPPSLPHWPGQDSLSLSSAAVSCSCCRWSCSVWLGSMSAFLQGVLIQPFPAVLEMLQGRSRAGAVAQFGGVLPSMCKVLGSAWHHINRAWWHRPVILARSFLALY